MVFNNSFSKRFVKWTSAGLSLTSTVVCSQETFAIPGGCKDFCLSLIKCLCPCLDCLFSNQVSGVWYAGRESENSSYVTGSTVDTWKKTKIFNVYDEKPNNEETETVKSHKNESVEVVSLSFNLSELLSETKVHNLGDGEKKLFLEKCGCFLKKYKEKICVKKEYKNQNHYKDLGSDWLIDLCNNSNFYSDYNNFFDCLKKFEAVLKSKEVRDFTEDVANLKRSLKRICSEENYSEYSSYSNSIS